MFMWENFFEGECSISVWDYNDFVRFCQVLAEKGVTWQNNKLVGSETLTQLPPDMHDNVKYVNERGVLRYEAHVSRYRFYEGHLHKVKSNYGSSIYRFCDCLYENQVDENGFEKELYPPLLTTPILI